MSNSNRNFVRLGSLLANCGVAELFLSELLGRRIKLRKAPVLALPWQSPHIFPDVEALGDDGAVYHIYIGCCGVKTLMKELQSYARNYDGSSEDLHIILIHDGPVFGEKQSYCQIGPAIINTAEEPTNFVGSTSVLYHVLSVAPNCSHRNAPVGIQQLLDKLAGEYVVEPGQLLRAMDEAVYEWYWCDDLRWDLKDTVSIVFRRAKERGMDDSQAMVECAEAERQERKDFVDLGIAWINSLPERLGDDVPASIVADELGIPASMVEQIRNGYVFSDRDLRAHYMGQRSRVQ